jgi:hypothetical protein
MSKTVRVTLKDGLGFQSGFISPASYACVLYYRVPESWLDGDQLLPEKREAMLENMYGKTWRSGNDDGSYYVVMNLEAQVLSAEDEQARGWLQHQSNEPDFKYWYYHITDDGQFQTKTREDF